MRSGRRTDESHARRVDIEFFRMVTDVLHSIFDILNRYLHRRIRLRRQRIAYAHTRHTMLFGHVLRLHAQ